MLVRCAESEGASPNPDCRVYSLLAARLPNRAEARLCFGVRGMLSLLHFPRLLLRRPAGVFWLDFDKKEGEHVHCVFAFFYAARLLRHLGAWQLPRFFSRVASPDSSHAEPPVISISDHHGESYYQHAGSTASKRVEVRNDLSMSRAYRQRAQDHAKNTTTNAPVEHVVEILINTLGTMACIETYQYLTSMASRGA